MHLGIDARALCETHPTGVSRYAANITKRIIEQHPEIDCSVFFSGTNVKKQEQKLRSQYPGENVQFVGVQKPNKLLHSGFFLPTPLTLDRFIPNVDVWFVPGFHFARFEKPYVITVHDLSFELYPDFWSWEKRLWHWAVNPRRLAGGADRVIAVSEHTAADVRKTYGVPGNNIQVVRSGVVMPVNVERKPDGKNVLMVSTIEPRKNIENAVKAVGQLRQRPGFQDVTLTIVGPQGWKTEKMVQEMQKLSWVQVRGFVRDVELDEMYRKAGVFFYPSYYEGFGLPPLEAMARGVPVIASGVSALPEMLGDAAMYVDPYDRYAMTDVLAEVLRDTDLQGTLSARGLAQAKKFSWDESANQTVNVLRDVYANRH